MVHYFSFGDFTRTSPPTQTQLRPDINPECSKVILMSSYLQHISFYSPYCLAGVIIHCSATPPN